MVAALLHSLGPAQAIATSKLPIKEITAFKDGHAFILRSGSAPLEKDGRIVLEDLPTPILGTFWPAIAAEGCSLRSVTTGQHRVMRERTALELRALLAANIGAEIVVREVGDIRYPATVLGLPARPPEEVAAGTPDSETALPERGDVVLLRTETSRKDTSAERVTDAGTRLVRLDRIVDVTFVKQPNAKLSEEVIRPQLVLHVSCKGDQPAKVPVTLAWLEQGFRWIPSYRVVLDGKGSGTVRLQATLVNDLVDLQETTVHLVIGVPSFVGKGTIDPISLQSAIAAVTSQMTAGQTMNSFSNAIMSQVASNDASFSPPAGAPGSDADEPGRKEQDLYVFTLEGITLKRKERMVVTIGEAVMPYRDVWKLDVGVTPPQEVCESIRGNADLARLMVAPKVKHEVRIENRGKAPFTTAPALVLLGDQLLAQGTMTYTPSGQACDVSVTTAIDLLVKKTDRETSRTPNAVRWNDNTYMRIDLEGALRIHNRRTAPVQIEIRRTFFGKVTTVSKGGTMEQVNVYEEDLGIGERGSPWRSHAYLMSAWSHVLNGIGRATWTVDVDAGKEVEVGYTWQYFWR